ncbi:MAG: AraC family transcriptional regulator [Rikenella sp.]|nr:AraC family transcriptional regulator [Rikenella sp.]
MDTTASTVIFRHQSDIHVGIQTVDYDRPAIGYIEQGTKLIHLADRYVTVRAGELFHLDRGTHYVENTPADPAHPFRQTLFFYTPSDLRNDFTPPQTVASANRLCAQCRNRTDIYTYPAWPVIEEFFHSVHRFVSARLHLSHPELSHLKLCELLQLLLTQPGCCVCRPVCQAVSNGPRTIDEVVRDNVLTDIALSELASLCGMSLSSFKNAFYRRFHTSPHKWLIEQRLVRARLQLISTSKSVSEIAHACRFNNVSHFIRLFRERFGTTPAAYRLHYSDGRADV